eukprot:gene147-265_t
MSVCMPYITHAQNAIYSSPDDLLHCNKTDDVINSEKCEACSVCLEFLFKGTVGTRFGAYKLACGHAYHLGCIGRHFYGGSFTCPMCREHVQEETRKEVLDEYEDRQRRLAALYAVDYDLKGESIYTFYNIRRESFEEKGMRPQILNYLIEHGKINASNYELFEEELKFYGLHRSALESFRGLPEDDTAPRPEPS